MQGTIAQLMGLTAYGNSFLSGNQLVDFHPNNTVFRFCKYVRFVDLEPSGGKWSERPFADDPLHWLERIKSEGVVQLRTRHLDGAQKEISDRMSAAFVGGGGRWLLECVTLTGSDFWEARWEVGNQKDPDQNIWHVSYGRIAKGVKPGRQELPSVADLRHHLGEVLDKTRLFANQNGLENFGACFSGALEALTSNPSEEKGYRLSPPGSLSVEAEQLINACQSAWVFGGMGSWNDVGFNEESKNREYEELSDLLFKLVNLSLVVAINPPEFPAPEPATIKKKWWNPWR